jgi:asparagine synthase (glutamine-hydrolysing)
VENNTEINKPSLVNILTLRYDPSIKPNLFPKSPKDFSIDESPVSIQDIEDSICGEMQNKLDSIGDKEISIALSGGVDSTLVLASLRKIKPEKKIHAVSIKFANSVDETPTASKIAEKFNAEHHIIHLENYLSELPKAISIIKLPFWDLHWYYVVKKAKTLSKTLISGDGGDELFGGYTFRYKKFLSLTSEDSSPIDKVKAYLSCHERDRVSDQADIFTKTCNFSWDSIYNKLLPFFDNDLNRINQVYLADYNGKLLYNFNPINTRIIDHYEMNLLTPLLNEKLITSASHIPSSSKYDEKSNVGKLHLRELLYKHGVSELVGKEKLGFNVNTLNLWKEKGHDLCKYFFDKSRLVESKIINKDWIEKYIDHSDLDVKYVNKFLGLLACEVWYRLFITKEIDSNDTLN